jgi:hypothetical protein
MEVGSSFAGVLRDQLSHHFKVAKLLDRDVLKHVADAGVLDVERLHPILQGRRRPLFRRTSRDLNRMWDVNSFTGMVSGGSSAQIDKGNSRPVCAPAESFVSARAA